MRVFEPSHYDYIVKENLGLVYQIVNRFYISPFERDDLIQAGLMGLFKAAQKFDESKGYRFSTYATYFILGEIKKELNKMNLIQVNSYFKKIAQKVNNASSETDFKKLASICQTSVENVAIATSYQNQVVLVEPTQLDCITSKPSFSDRFIIHQSSFNNIDKEIFQLRFFYQWNQKEIASKLKVNQSSVSRRLKQMIKIMVDYS